MARVARYRMVISLIIVGAVCDRPISRFDLVGGQTALTGRLRLPTHEIRSLVDAAGALVFGDLRKRAQWTRAVHLTVCTVRCVQHARRFALFYPLLERA